MTLRPYRYLSLRGERNGQAARVPTLDMCETSDDLVVNFELPGVREKDISPLCAHGLRAVM